MDRIEDADDDIGIPKLAFIGSNEEKYLSNIYNGKISLKYAEFKQRDLEKKRGVTSIYSYKHIKQAYTALFHQKIESVQYNSALAITGAIRGTSKEKIYHELGLESLEKRRWYRKLCCFYKIFRSQSPQYLFNINTYFCETIQHMKC